MFYYKILLIGASGRGKTFSFRNLPRDTTGFINVENKPYPFKGGFDKFIIPMTSQQVLDGIMKADQNPGIKVILIDSFSAYQDLLMAEARATKTGWAVMTHYNEHIGKFNNYVKQCNKPVIVTAHYELLGDELGLGKEKRAKVKGKEWEGFIEKDYTIVLYAESKIPAGQKMPQYFFSLYNDGTTSAKTPPDIFGPDILTIDNDCQLVLQKIEEFQK